MSDREGGKPKVEKFGVVEYEHVGKDYLEERRLLRRAGAWLIWGLGVAYVISGEYYGWQFGFAQGVGGMLVASILIAAMYTFMVYGISEMASAIPATGGPYAFGRRALGVWGGFINGLGAVIEYLLAISVIGTGIGLYLTGLPGLEDLPSILGLEAGEWLYILIFVAFLLIHFVGVRETLVSVFIVAAIASVVLVVWFLYLLPDIDFSRFTDVPVDPNAAGASTWFPTGWVGILAAIPYAAWFYLAIEGTPMAAEETTNPERDVPKGSIAAMFTLIAFSALAFLAAGGTQGALSVSTTANPIGDPVAAIHGENWFFWFVVIVGLSGLIASFHSVIYAYSRIIYALSRAGYFPRWLSLTSSNRKIPYWALTVPALISMTLIIVLARGLTPPEGFTELSYAGSILIQISVFAALITYIVMMLAYIRLKVREPNLPRPYKAPGGMLMPTMAMIIAIVSLSAGIVYTTVTRWTIFWTAVAFLIGMAYFWLYSRHRLVAEAPEEEFAVIERAEAELDAGGGGGS
jgi:ethanolamine permease